MATTAIYETGDAALVSADRRTTLVPVVLTGNVNGAGKTITPLIDLVHRRPPQADSFKPELQNPATDHAGSVAPTQQSLEHAHHVRLPS